MRLLRMLQCVSKLPENYGNFPASFVKKQTEMITWKTPKGPQYRRVVMKRRKFYYYMARPWEEQFKEENSFHKEHRKIFVEPIKEWFMFRGDRVEILVGKDKGKQGIVNYCVKERNFVCVEGLNCVYKYSGAQGDFPGTLFKDEMPLLVTREVALVDPSDSKPTSIQWRFTERGEKVRVSVRTGRVIPIPKLAEETREYKTKDTYDEQPKDTRNEQLKQITFEPVLKTFELDIIDRMGIEEDRIPKKLYWY